MYERVQKPNSSWSPAFHQEKSESLFRPRPFSIQPQADTEASQEQEIPAYSRAARDAISAKLFQSMGGGVQSQAQTETQKPESEGNPAFDHQKSESFFRPRPLSIQPQADTEASQEQEHTPNRALSLGLTNPSLNRRLIWSGLRTSAFPKRLIFIDFSRRQLMGK